MRAVACVDTGYVFSDDGSLPTVADAFIPASPTSSRWSPSLSASLYRIDGWGAPYFAANSSGNISVRPHGDETLPHQDIDLMKVVKNVMVPKSSGGLGLQLPLIVRFPDVLKNRLECLQSAFDSAVKSQGYGSHYQGVFPVKCNQDRFIVEDIVNFGSPFRFGLEAGSKPEILLAMSCLCKGNPDAFLVCNGFKDAEYVSLALLGRKLAFNTMIVLEQEHELDLVINLSQKMNVRPLIGLRAKLRTKQSNHYGSYSGEKGKFGLTSTQIVSVVAKLSESGMLDCLQLLHFHIGSMIPSSSLLSQGVSEAAQIYCELVRLGAHMKIIDVGGGLGIDYDGSKSGEPDQSVTYTLEEYAEAVVASISYIYFVCFINYLIFKKKFEKKLLAIIKKTSSNILYCLDTRLIIVLFENMDNSIKKKYIRKRSRSFNQNIKQTGIKPLIAKNLVRDFFIILVIYNCLKKMGFEGYRRV
ncbi:unnamed protein product [Brassica oleracea var. botrytis]|uniref:Arginine decarboxylase n=1 Tax=Brassica napus TaxID=3708 RepID=A0A816QY62_BRANA|nr:unnamed protein product [Brassica napus]